MNMVKRTWAEISLNAIEHNYNVIRNKVADDTKVCCVIKADGYGHGAVELSQIYEKLGADFFAVSNDNIVCGNEKSVGDLALCRKTLAAAGCAEYQAVRVLQPFPVAQNHVIR